MKLFSYIVARDFGFAPNPFEGTCTLATCKPQIRQYGQVGDWVIGTGCAKHNRSGFLVYVMRIAETMSFDTYWEDSRFQQKKPDLRRSRKHAFGDNIYHKINNHWTQLNSHHSYADGTPNPRNIQKDTKVNRVLIAEEYAYWGGSGPELPKRFRENQNFDLCIRGQGYKNRFPSDIVCDFVDWFKSLKVQGCLGRPIDWP